MLFRSQPPPVERQVAEGSRRPAREQKVPVREGNVYGESRHPTDISKDIEKWGSWKQMIGEQPSRSRTAPPLRDEQVPGPSYTLSLPQSRQRSAERNLPIFLPPSMHAHREPTPVISSSSSDDEEEEDLGSDPIPAEVLPQPQPSAPSPEIGRAHV